MSKYSIFYNKEDEKIAHKQIAEMEKSLGLQLDWKKVKRMNGDNIATLQGILERRMLKEEKTFEQKLHNQFNNLVS